MAQVKKTIRWLTAAALLFILVLLAWQCIDIYIDGNAASNLDENGVHISNVYSMEDVIRRLKSLAVPIWFGILITCISCLLHVQQKHKTSIPALSSENHLRLLRARVAELPNASRRETRIRLIIRGITALFVLVECVICLAYLLDQNNFLSWDLENVMGNMMLAISPHVIVSFLVLMAASYAIHRSRLREIEHMKKADKHALPSTDIKKQVSLWPMRFIMYAIAVLFIVLGIVNGGLRDVLVKAINICTECIGLG